MGKNKFERPRYTSLEVDKISSEKLKILEYIKSEIEKSEDILSARVYGSWLHSTESIDLDICAMIPSNNGIVESNVYQRLKIEKERLSKTTGQDVDIVPHTLDEITDFRSDLYCPRYNPSLVFGKDIKGRVEIKPIFNKRDKFTHADIQAHVLLDNRTVCRRQILRSLNPAESRIFVSKLLHGPGNALTYYSCKEKIPFLVSPSDLFAAMKTFDQIYHVDSTLALDFLSSCRKKMDPENAPPLLKWYEHLVAYVLNEKIDKKAYNSYCLELVNIYKKK